MIRVGEIQRIVAEHYGLPSDIMRVPDGVGSRNRKEAHARQDAMYIASRLTSHGYSNLGRLFGGRDHTTIIYGIRQAEQRIITDRKRREVVRAAVRQVLS